MQVNALLAKIHRAQVTAADLEYEGSLTLDRELMAAAGFRPYQQIHVYNITTGARFETYLIEGGPGSVQINGAAAHLATPGDRIIIATYASIPFEQLNHWQPRVVLVNENNEIKHASGPMPEEMLVGV